MRLFRNFIYPTYVEYASVTIERAIIRSQCQATDLLELVDLVHTTWTLPKTQSIVSCQNTSVPKVPAKGRLEQTPNPGALRHLKSFQDYAPLTFPLSLSHFSFGDELDLRSKHLTEASTNSFPFSW